MLKLWSSPAARLRLGLLCLALGWIVGMALAWNDTLHGDEFVHWAQISLWIHHDYQWLDAWLTTVPGYHALQALILWLCGAEQARAARVLNGVIAVSALVCFWWIRRTLAQPHGLRATVLFAFLPILYVFHFLIYTDAWALALLLAAVLASLRGRHGWAAAALCGVLLMRQHYVFWAAALPMAHGLARVLGRAPRQELVAMARTLWPYVVPCAIFLVYWWVNGSISFSNAQSRQLHPDLRWTMGNPLFATALIGAMFPLQCLDGLRRFLQIARERRGHALAPVMIALLGIALFDASHPFNQVIPEFFPRNALLIALQASTAAKILFCLFATAAAIGVLYTRYATPIGWITLAMALVFVGASWLIETRYAIVPAALFLALRVELDERRELITSAWSILLAITIAILTFDGLAMT
jgi:alpha-1,2-glucosyltransferase